MAKLALHQGAYEARSPIANAQVCYNLVPEQNPPDAPFPVTHYPAPGLSLGSDFTGLLSGGVRGIYQASNGVVVAVIGSSAIGWMGPGNTAASYELLGTIPDNGFPVSICDNGTTIVFVDGSSSGWMCPIGVPAGSLVQITDTAFYGSNRVDFIDTFMVFNQPLTANFYTTTSNVVVPFDPTYVAAKEGWNDKVQCVACLHDNIWILGNVTTEIWFNAGGATFPFARMPNSILQQGCVAPNSVVIADNAIYWISQDRWGRNMMMRGEGYAARRVSTFAVEDEWNQYPSLAGAVGMSYQLAGHETVGWLIGAGNAWWAYDASTQMWHKRTYNGTSEPWLPYCMAGWSTLSFNGTGWQPNTTLVGDRSGPRILILARDNYTDVGVPITRQRSWTHQQQDGQRINYTRFALSMAGNQMNPDTVTLDWSDNAGLSYGQPVNQTINNQANGQYLWRRLGYARDRVYRATWSGQGEFALNGAYSDGTPAVT